MSAQPLTDASAVLVTRFVGDVTSLEQAGARSEQIVSQTASRINQTLSQPAAGFQQLASSAQQSAATTAESFSLVNQSAQLAASNISIVGASAQESSAQVAAASGQAAASVGAVGTAAQQAGANVQAGLAPAGATLLQLEQQFKANEAAIVQYGAQIADNRARMAGLAAEMNTLTQTGGKYSQAMNEQGKVTQILSQEFTDLRSRYQNLGAETRVLSSSQGQLRAAQAQTTQTMAAMTDQTSFLVKLFGTKTNMVATAGTAFMGYDRVLQTALGSMGGVSLAVSLLITAFGFLIQKMLHSGKATEELAALNKDLMASDLALARAFEELAAAQELTSKTGEKQVEIHKQLTQADFNAAITSFTDAYKQYAPAIEKTAQAQSELAKTQETNNRLQQQGIDVASIHINEINRMQTAIAGALSPAEKQLYTDILAVRNSMYEQQQAVLTNVEAHGKLEEKINKTVQTIVEFGRQNELSTDQMIGMARSAAGAGAAFDEMAARIRNATGALAAYNAQLANFRVPAIDIKATTEGLAKARGQINETIKGLVDAGKSQADVTAAVKGQIDQYTKSVQTKIAIDAAAAGKTLTHKEAQATFNREMQKSPDHVGLYGKTVIQAEKNTKAFSESTKGAGGGAKAARAAISEYSDGMMGLSKAITVVNSALEKGTFDILFDKVPAKARKAADELKAAAKQLVSEINETLSKRTEGGGVSLLGNSVKLTIDDLKTLGSEGVKPLTNLVQAYKIAGDEVHSILVKQLVAKNEIEVWADVWAKATDKAKSDIKALGVTVKEVMPELTNKFDLQKLIMQEYERVSSGVLDKIASDTESSVGRQKVAWNDLIQTLPVEQMRQRLEQIRLDIETSVPIQQVRTALDIHSEIDSVISDFERWGEQIGLTGDALEKFVENQVRAAMSEIPGITQRELNHTIEIWKRELNKLPGIWERVFGQLPSQTKKALGNVLKLIEKLPGEMGDHLRDALDEVERWVDFVDSALAVLHDIFPEIPESLSKALEKMVDVFRDKGQTAADVTAEEAQAILDEIKLMTSDMEAVFTDDMGNVLFTGADVMRDGMDQVATAAEQGATRVVQAISDMIAGIGLLLGGIRQGGVGGAISGAVGGFKIGATIGSIIPGIGTLIGGVIGAVGGFFAGLFGGGKSELEKAQEAAQLQEAKDRVKLSQQAVLQSVEETKQSLLETASKATQLLKDIGLHIDIPKDVFDAWFKDLDELMRRLAARMEAWSKEHSEELKAAAEEMGVVAEAAAAIAVALAAVGQSFRVSDAQIDALVASWEYLLTALADMEERLANETERHAKKLARRTEVVPDYVAQTADAIRAIADLPTITTEKVTAFRDSAILILTTVAEIFEAVNQFQLRRTGQAAEMALPILEFTTGLSNTLRAAVDVPMPTEADWANLKKGAEAAFDFVFKLFEEMQAETLARAAALSETGNPIMDFISNLFGALGAGGELGSIPDLDFERIKQQARGLLNAVIELAEEISSEAAAKGSTLSESAKEIPSFVSALVGGIKSASEITGIQLDVANLKQQGKALIQAVVELADELDSEGVEAARKLSESGIIITEFASSLASAIAALADNARAGDYYIRIAVESYRAMVTQFAALKSEISPEILSAAEEVARRGAGIFGNIQTIATALQSTANIQIAQPTALIQAMRTWVDGLSSVRDEMQHGYDVSAEILLLSEGIEANLNEAALNLAAGAKTLGAALSVTGAATAAPSSSFIAPQQSGSSITVQVDARGAVIDEAKLTDKILSGLTQLERGQRIVRVTR